jgi:hypothetical protein
MASKVFSVGDYKNFELKDGSRIKFQIIGFDHDITPDGWVCPLTFELVDCLPSGYRMGERDTTEGSWEKTWLRTHLNNERGNIYRIIPDEILELAEPVVKLTADTYRGENNIIETVDKFFVLSEKERYGRCFFSAPGEGKWYEYYKQEDTSYVMRRNGSPAYVWERSPCSSTATQFCLVYTNGTAANGYASSAYGVSFGFSL